MRTAQRKTTVKRYHGGGGGSASRHRAIELRVKFVGIIYRKSSLDVFSIFVSFNRENILSCDLPQLPMVALVVISSRLRQIVYLLATIFCSTLSFKNCQISVAVFIYKCRDAFLEVIRIALTTQ